MKIKLTKVLTVCYIITLLLTSFISFFPSNCILKMLLTFTTILFLFSSVLLSKGFMQFISITAIILGSTLYYFYKIPESVFINALLKGTSVLILFTAIPLLSFPFKRGDYLSNFKMFSPLVVKHNRKVFPLFVIINFLLCTVLNIGGLIVMKEILEQGQLTPKYRFRVFTAAYCCYMLFAPLDGFINILISLTSSNFQQYSSYGLIGCLVIVTISTTLVLFEKKQNLSEMSINISTKTIFKLITFFIIIFLLILLSILSRNIIKSLNPMSTTAVVIFFFSLIWMFFIGYFKNFDSKLLLKEYKEQVLSYTTFLPFLLSITFLGTIFSSTPLQSNLSTLLTQISTMPLYFIIQIFMGITLLAALLGVHMLIPISAIAFTFTPESLGTTPHLFALIILTTWLPAMTTSPFTPFSAIAAECSGLNPKNASLKNNFIFALLIIIIMPAVIIFLN